MSLWRRRSTPEAARAEARPPLAEVYAADRSDLAAMSANGVAVVGMGLGYLAVAFYAVGTGDRLPPEVLAAAPIPLFLIMGGAIYFWGLALLRAQSVRELEKLLLAGTSHESQAAALGFRAVDAPAFDRVINPIARTVIAATWLLSAGFACYCLWSLSKADVSVAAALPLATAALYAAALVACALPLIRIPRRVARAAQRSSQ